MQNAHSRICGRNAMQVGQIVGGPIVYRNDFQISMALREDA
jgi:hypothetical protein